MSRSYSHTQFGTLVILLFGAGVLVLAVLGFRSGFHPLMTFMLAVLIILILLFYSLKVTIEGGRLRLSYGVGLISKTIDLSQVHKAYPVRNKWYYGWGIRYTPHGWLYNISGLKGVELVFDSGRKVRIGTDQPEKLSRAVSRATTTR